MKVASQSLRVLPNHANLEFQRHGVLLLLNGCTLIFNDSHGYIPFLRCGVSKTPHSSNTFQRILLVCIKTVFCNSVIFVSIPIVSNLLSKALAGVPRTPTTNGTTFIFHTFFSSLARFKHFSTFSTSLSSTLVSYSIAKSIIWHSWCSLSNRTFRTTFIRLFSHTHQCFLNLIQL